MLKYFAAISPLSSRDESGIPYSLKIRGIAVTTEPNKNGWAISKTLLKDVANQLISKTLRINHGNSVTDVIGKIVSAEAYENQVAYVAEIIGSDAITTAVKEKILNGLLDSVSIGVDVDEVICSVCGKATRSPDGERMIHDPKTHGAEAYEIINKLSVKELSVVLDPAYDKTKFNVAASFNESINQFLAVTPTAAEAAEVTDVMVSEAESRPVESEPRERGETAQMSAPVVPTAPAEQRSSPSLEDVVKLLQGISLKADEAAKKMAEIEARLKSLEEAEEARRKAEEAKKAEEAEDAEEADDAEDVEDEKVKKGEEAALKKRKTTLVASEIASKPWAAELAKFILHG